MITPVDNQRPMHSAQPVQVGNSIELNPGEVDRSIVELRTPHEGSESIIVTARQVTRAVNQNVIAIGRLFWGMGGSQFQAEFDMINGVQFSLPANYIRVAATYSTDNAAIVPQPSLQVFAGLGYGTITHHAQAARRTVHLFDITTMPGVMLPELAPGVSSQVVPIPPFATNFTLTAAPFAAPPGTFSPARIDILDAVGVPIVTYTYTSPANTAHQAENLYPIPNQGFAVQVTNTGLVDSNLYNLIFALCL